MSTTNVKILFQNENNVSTIPNTAKLIAKKILKWFYSPLTTIYKIIHKNGMWTHYKFGQISFFFVSHLFIHWHLYLLSSSLLNVNIVTYYTNSLSYRYNLQFSPVKFVISGFEFGNVTIRHWLLWDRWHSCPNNLIVRSRCAKMSIENIPEALKHANFCTY